MRICMATHTLVRTDGQGRINYEIARHLAWRGHQLVLLSTTIDPDLARERNVSWRPVTIPWWARRAFVRYLVFSAKARRAIRSDPRGYDVVLLNGCITNYPADVNIAMFVHSNWNKSPYHATFRTDGFYGLYQQAFTALHARWERREFRRAGRVVALSGMVRDSLIQDVGLDPARIRVIEPGVDTDEFHPPRPEEPNRLRELIGVGPEAFVICFAGDLKSNRKNLDLVLNAMSRLGPEFHLACAGHHERSPYPGLARELGLGDRVHFIGKRQDLGRLFRGADAFAFPSHYDTFALVVTEAMASGLPVITAPSAGASTFIRDGENGVLLRDSSDLDGLVSALGRLASDRPWARSLGRAARETAEGLTWGAMARRYEAILGSAVRPRPPGRRIDARISGRCRLGQVRPAGRPGAP